jgi:anti-anti-sigma factor
MDLSCTDLPDGIRRIALRGRMDIEGATGIDLRFTPLVVTGNHLVLVDLADLDFIASLGISVIVQAAKSVALRGGALVLARPRPSVKQVLTSTRIGERIPVFDDEDEARAALRSGNRPAARAAG